MVDFQIKAGISKANFQDFFKDNIPPSKSIQPIKCNMLVSVKGYNKKKNIIRRDNNKKFKKTVERRFKFLEDQSWMGIKKQKGRSRIELFV